MKTWADAKVGDLVLVKTRGGLCKGVIKSFQPFLDNELNPLLQTMFVEWEHKPGVHPYTFHYADIFNLCETEQEQLEFILRDTS